MCNAVLENAVSVPVPCDGEQLELFPELPKELPKNLASLESGNRTARFVANYFLTNNATQSVIDAGYDCTYESARRMGSKLLTRNDINAALAHLDKKIEENALVSKQGVIASIMRTRDRASEAGGVAMLRVVNECNRLLAQIKGMLRDKVEVSTGDLGSLAELKALTSGAIEETSNEAASEQK